LSYQRDKKNGELRGDELVEYAVKLVKEQQVTTRPKNILKDDHHILSSSKTHSKNFGGRPLARPAAKNVRNVAKALLLKSYGLQTGGNTIGNVFMSGKLIKDQDKSLRRKMGDFSNNFQGTLRSFFIDGGDSNIKDNDSLSLKILLFNETQIMIHHKAAELGKMTFHLDGTKFEPELGIELVEGAIVLYHIASINGNAFVDEQDIYEPKDSS